jgi:transposase
MASLGGWKGYIVGTVQRFEAGVHGPTPQVWIVLHHDRVTPMVCSGCGQATLACHDVVDRWVRDLPIFDAQTHLLLQRCRVACPTCGPRLEQLDWLEPYARVTTRLAQSVARLCAAMPLKQVAAYLGLGWDQVKAIDKGYLGRTLGEPDLSGLQSIVMDEFAIQKGHRYATVIVEPSCQRVLWVGRGRRREEVRPFFAKLGPEGCRRLQAVAMDMNGAYEEEVRAWCPQARIVYDLFHVVAKYGREVVDRVRVDQANQLRHDRPARQLIKGSRWLLLKNRSHLSDPQQRVRLKELLAANAPLFRVYVLKDDLKRLGDYTYTAAARRSWEGWHQRAIRSRIGPLKEFARKLKAYLPGILAHCRWPLHTSLLEGINNKIKVIKRMAYGYRDDDYFFLKIRQAYPGNTG